jgi:hypothetical protein
MASSMTNAGTRNHSRGEPGVIFHFAMASRWDEGRLHRLPFTVDGVTKWVEGCLRYTKGQLT